MATAGKKTRSTSATVQPVAGRSRSTADAVESILDELKQLASKKTRAEMGTRYGIHVAKAFGVSVGNLQKLAKRVGRNHELAAALRETGWYEARILAAYLDDPDQVTAVQMDCWCRDFDNWAICDTLCFALFDRTEHAWRKVSEWSARRSEFVRRAGLALLWGLTVHDKVAGDASFLAALKQVEVAAADDRHFVKKAVSMALRAVGKRNAVLHEAAVELARRLAESAQDTARSVGKEALRELTSAAVVRRVSIPRKS